MLKIQMNQHFVKKPPLLRHLLKNNVWEQILSAIMAMIKFMSEVDLAVTPIVSAMLKIQMNQHFVKKLLKNNVLEQILSAIMAMIKFMLEVDLAVTHIVSAMLKIQMNPHFVKKPPLLRHLLKNNVWEQILSAIMAMIKFMSEVDLAVTPIVSAMLKIQMNQHFVKKLLKNNVLEQILSAIMAMIKFM